MKKILFTGGGTGGHIYPNLAIMDLLKNKYELIYMGSKNSMEQKVVSPNYKFYAITTVKLKRSLSIKNLIIPFKLIAGINQAKKILKKEKPDLIFSKGGFVSIPVIIAGHLLKIPCLTHESDITLGLANKIIKNKCKYVLTSFEQTSNSLNNGIYTGSPIRKEIVNASVNNFNSKYKLNNNKPNILIFGGSLGSKTINEFIFQNINILTKKYNIYHIVGKNNSFNISIPNYFQYEYVKDIQDLLVGVDMVITRGGSNALFELLTLKKPMLIIPLSKRESRGDQILNAEYFKSKNLANVLYEEDLSCLNILNSIEQTLKNKNNFMNNASKFNALGNDKIISIIEDTLKKR